MGQAAPSKPPACSIPSRPFDKHGRRRSCLGAMILLPRRTLHSSLSSSTTSTLMQLVLLQDWQRVLIRATLFPQEISKPSIVKLYGTYWKLLPLHLACALKPPPKVVACLLAAAPGALETPVERRKPKLRLGLSSSWKQFSSSSYYYHQAGPDDRKELLTTREENEMDHDEDDDDHLSFDTTSTNNKNNNNSAVWRNNGFWMNHSKGSLVSLEQSIGDMTSCATETFDNDDETATALDTSLCHFLDKTGVVLQLTESGGILPMPVDVPKSSTSTSMSESFVSLAFPQNPLLQAAQESKAFLLPIHIACLYQASPLVLQLLLQEDPMGALSAVMGMLPIHLVAAGWTVVAPFEETLTRSQTIQQHYLTMTGSSSSSSSSSEDEPNRTRHALQVLIQGLPELLMAKSGSHGMTPAEYVEQTMEGGVKKDECLAFLHQAQEDYQQGNRADPGLPQVDGGGDPSSDRRSSSPVTIPSEIHCLSASSAGSNLSAPPQSVLHGLLLEGNWQEVINLVEMDPSQAREWHYGIDNHPTSPSSGDKKEDEPILWKRLALHLACTVAAPIGVIDLLLQVYPPQAMVECVDPHNGSTPLHLACQFGGASLQVIRALIQARTAWTKAVDARGRLPLHYAILSLAPYATIDLLVQHDPASVLCPDQEGKTPLQYAQRSYPVGNPVIGLLELVWM